MSTLIAASALWGELDDDHDGYIITAHPDGTNYITDFAARGVMLRADIVSMTEAETTLTGYYEWPNLNWTHLGLRAEPSTEVFWRFYLEPLYANGLAVWPLARAITLTHNAKKGIEHAPPHAVLYGEDIVGWIIPRRSSASDETVRLCDFQAELRRQR